MVHFYILLGKGELNVLLSFSFGRLGCSFDIICIKIKVGFDFHLSGIFVMDDGRKHGRDLPMEFFLDLEERVNALLFLLMMHRDRNYSISRALGFRSMF